MKNLLLFTVMCSIHSFQSRAQTVIMTELGINQCGASATAQIKVSFANWYDSTSIFVDWGNGDIDTTSGSGLSFITCYDSLDYDVIDNRLIFNTTYNAFGTYNVSSWAEINGVTVAGSLSTQTINVSTNVVQPFNSVQVQIFEGPLLGSCNNIDSQIGTSDIPVVFSNPNDTTIVTLSSSSLPNLNNSYTYPIPSLNANSLLTVDDSWLVTHNATLMNGNYLSINSTSFDVCGVHICPVMIFIEQNVPAIVNDVYVNGEVFFDFIAPLQTGAIGINTGLNYNPYLVNDTLIVTMNCPNSFIPNLSNLINPTLVGNLLTFEVNNLPNYGFFFVEFTFPGSIPADTVVCFPISISNLANETIVFNNYDTICATVLNSYDPNSKWVDQPLYIEDSNQETFTYTINFQNDGNFQAINVIIKDTLDSNLDMNSFEVVNSKHSVFTSLDVNSREVTFTFPNCYLSSSSNDLLGSQGFIRYKISEAANLPAGTVIENTAAIYFDFNAPIITNTAQNINSVLSVKLKENDVVEMYPNPAQNTIVFNGAVVNSVKIIDLAGKTVLSTSSLPSNNLSIDELTNGMYHVILETEKGTQKLKLVVSK